MAKGEPLQEEVSVFENKITAGEQDLLHYRTGGKQTSVS